MNTTTDVPGKKLNLLLMNPDSSYIKGDERKRILYEYMESNSTGKELDEDVKRILDNYSNAFAIKDS